MIERRGRKEEREDGQWCSGSKLYDGRRNTTSYKTGRKKRMIYKNALLSLFMLNHRKLSLGSTGLGKLARYYHQTIRQPASGHFSCNFGPQVVVPSTNAMPCHAETPYALRRRRARLLEKRSVPSFCYSHPRAIYVRPRGHALRSHSRSGNQVPSLMDYFPDSIRSHAISIRSHWMFRASRICSTSLALPASSILGAKMGPMNSSSCARWASPTAPLALAA